MKFKFLGIFILLSIVLKAQVGIGTADPKSTLDVTGKPTDTTIIDGLITPRLTGDQLKAKDHLYTLDHVGTIVFVSSGIASGSTTPKTINVTTKGYYYFDGNIWLQLGQGTNKPQFYAPSIMLPTSSVGVSTTLSDDISYDGTSQTYKVNLYNIYYKQYNLVGAVSGSSRTAIKSSTAQSLDLYTKEQLDYFITYFDNEVFDPESISLDVNGVLTYKILEYPNLSDKTFMNIIFKVK